MYVCLGLSQLTWSCLCGKIKVLCEIIWIYYVFRSPFSISHQQAVYANNNFALLWKTLPARSLARPSFLNFLLKSGVVQLLRWNRDRCSFRKMGWFFWIKRDLINQIISKTVKFLSCFFMLWTVKNVIYHFIP